MLSIYGVPGRSPVVYTIHGSNRRLGCGVVACALAAAACLWLSCRRVRTYGLPAQRHFIHYSLHAFIPLILVLVSFALHCYLPVETRSTIALP